MRNRSHHTRSSDRDLVSELPCQELKGYFEDWYLDGEIRQLSALTLANRRRYAGKLLWYLGQREAEVCGTRELRAFFAYLSTEHGEDEGGRWGTGWKGKAKPATVSTYFRYLRAFFQFLLDEGVLDLSPMATLKPPIVRSDQVQPFTPDQVTALLEAARRSRYPLRDTALVLFLFDTGCRSSEVCDLRMKDVDLRGRRCTIHGKGNKSRAVYFGAETYKALYNYIRQKGREEDDFLFLSERSSTGGGFTRWGLLQNIERLGEAAHIEACRCSPHTFRHTFAIEFLRAGGDTFTLQKILGHTTLSMTNQYVSLAQADIERQHRRFSPADARKRRKKG